MKSLSLALAVCILVVLIHHSEACPTGWEVCENSCYKFVETRKNWQAARESCKSLGGYLATIDTVTEASAFKAFRISTGRSNNYYWIGAQQQRNAKGPFVWVASGARFNRVLWSRGEPNQVDRIRRQCVDLGTPSQQMNMNDYPCASALSYICEKAKCPRGSTYNRFAKTCMKVVNARKSWPQAQKYCTSIGGYLAAFKSVKSAEWFRKLMIKQRRRTSLWIGGKRQGNHFVWDGRFQGPISSCHVWAPGEPRMIGNCVSLWKQRGFRFDDAHCRGKAPFVCEIPLK